MTRKPLFIIIFFCGFNICLCSKAIGQNIEVSLDIELYSPFISKYSKDQMAKMLLDTIITHCQSKFTRLGRQVNIYRKGTPRPKSNLPGYKLELNVKDTVTENKRFTRVHMVRVFGKFYEEEILAETIQGWTGGGGSYSEMPGAKRVEGGKVVIDEELLEAKTTEAGAIAAYFLWGKIEAWIIMSSLMPLSLTDRIPPRNIFEKDELDKLESFAEMVVNVQPEKMEASKKSEVNRLIIMINNIFFVKQGHESSRRSLSKGRSQFNYYFTTDSLGYTGPTVHGNPIELKLIIESVGQDNYQIRFEFDEKKYSMRNFFGAPQKERIIQVSGETLRNRPSKINNDIKYLIYTFVDSNTR